jgi:hypothetical protein
VSVFACVIEDVLVSNLLQTTSQTDSDSPYVFDSTSLSDPIKSVASCVFRLANVIFLLTLDAALSAIHNWSPSIRDVFAVLKSILDFKMLGFTTRVAHVHPVSVHAWNSAVVAISTLPGTVSLALPVGVPVSTLAQAPALY